jgi:hypothetical protein
MNEGNDSLSSQYDCFLKFKRKITCPLKNNLSRPAEFRRSDYPEFTRATRVNSNMSRFPISRSKRDLTRKSYRSSFYFVLSSGTKKPRGFHEIPVQPIKLRLFASRVRIRLGSNRGLTAYTARLVFGSAFEVPERPFTVAARAV